jgi:hypothetical protein
MPLTLSYATGERAITGGGEGVREITGTIERESRRTGD